MSRSLFGLGLAALLICSSGAAEAARLRATADVNVRSGPGMNHRVVGHLASGQRVSVSTKQGRWSKIGASRWVSSRYLGGGKRVAAKRIDRRVAEPAANYTATTTGIATSDPIFGLKPEDGWEWERMHLLRHAH
ncbi:SH3 domain-containing protein [Flaviflagellibacter deserti]|uniref:SH3 domain-containing protein n=1 Tax=Flaviflagellibacter deserti TaxID=2267266 RepID=A0ABV9YYU0_9HYPH